MPYYRNKTNKVLLIMAPGGNGCNADDAEENWISDTGSSDGKFNLSM